MQICGMFLTSTDNTIIYILSQIICPIPHVRESSQANMFKSLAFIKSWHGSLHTLKKKKIRSDPLLNRMYTLFHQKVIYIQFISTQEKILNITGLP